ncbi:TPA: hypothetical protein ACH3X3_015101 [Trebouxia sp. C0006]
MSSCPAFHQSLVIVGNTDKCTAPCRHRESAAGVQFGASLLGVGLAATAYHASSGKLRKHLRKLDYWSISLSTTAAVRAALPAKSQARARLSSIGLLALVPFQPSAVTAINASIAQVEFA